MPRIKLNQRAIDRFEAPHPSGKQTMYWDQDTPGFGVRVSGTTSQMSFVAQRDLPNGRSRRVTIAAVGEITLDQAREQARDSLHGMRKGVDPKAHRGADTFRAVFERYLQRNDLAEKTRTDYRRAIETHLPDWLDLRLGDITGDMVEARHRKIASTGNATANLTMRAFRAMFNFAAERDSTLPQNPTKRLRRQWFKVARRETLVKADQLAKFYAGVLKLPNPVQRDYLLLLLFTGLRRTEAASLTWHDIDFEAKLIRLPASRTKGQRKLDLPLTDVVLRMLQARRKIGDTRFVFPAVSETGHISEPKYPLSLVAEMTGISISAHDLRRTFITAAESTDISPLALKALVNHAVGNDVTSGYVIMTTDRLRAPAQKVADVLKKWCKVR